LVGFGESIPPSSELVGVLDRSHGPTPGCAKDIRSD
jgi:hypothetical protein